MSSEKWRTILGVPYLPNNSRKSTPLSRLLLECIFIQIKQVSYSVYAAAYILCLIVLHISGTLAWNSLWDLRTNNSTVHNNVAYGLGKAGKLLQTFPLQKLNEYEWNTLNVYDRSIYEPLGSNIACRNDKRQDWYITLKSIYFFYFTLHWSGLQTHYLRFNCLVARQKRQEKEYMHQYCPLLLVI